MSKSRDLADLAAHTSSLSGMVARSADAKAGLIAFFAADTAPSGWLECDGSAVSRTQYADLFAHLGTDFGAGDGSTTFNLPDLRGEFIRGWDHGRGVDAGRGFGTAQGQGTQKHAALIDDSGDRLRRKRITGLASWTDDRSNSYTNATGTTSLSSGTDVVTTGTGETRPRNIAMLACIKT